MTTTPLTRRTYAPVVQPHPVTSLPFVADVKIGPRKTQRSFWAIERTADYGMACDKGREYAAHYLQFVKDGNGGPGLLTWIAGHMAEANALRHVGPGDSSHGYAVGFFSFLDGALRQAMRNTCPFALAQAEIDYYARIEAARQQENCA